MFKEDNITKDNVHEMKGEKMDVGEMQIIKMEISQIVKEYFHLGSRVNNYELEQWPVKKGDKFNFQSGHTRGVIFNFEIVIFMEKKSKQFKK